MQQTAGRTMGSEPSVSSALREFRVALARVTDALDRGDASQSATAPLAAWIREQVGCSVVSFWSLLTADGQPVMSRIGGYDGVAEAPLTAPLMRSTSAFNMKELTEAAICIVPRPAGSPVEDSFVPACIDVTIAANGEFFGIIRCEFHDQQRPWRLAETTLLRSFAGEIALRRARRRARSVRPRPAF